MVQKQLFLLLLLAMAKELVPSSHGHISPLVPRNVCQKATLNRSQSYTNNNVV
ncbi:hypothetical protein HanPSC8_Chr09g0393341 [Helianthus annuus]|nr:hypothetical protein HanPSC8_Chr09g0393341 [Helianthus annuus]